MASHQETGQDGSYVQEWEVLNPEGVKFTQEVRINPHPPSLSDKTVVMTWNGKPNGDVFLNRVGELLLSRAKIGKLIKLWEVYPNLIRTYSLPRSAELAGAAAGQHPDLVINSTCD
jgi:hypothetical protein